MNQDDQNQKASRQPLIIPQRPIVRETPLYHSTNQSGGFNDVANSNVNQDSAANILRTNIDKIYQDDPNSRMTASPPRADDTQISQPIEQTHSTQEATVQTEPQPLNPENDSPPVQQQPTSYYRYSQEKSSDPYEKTFDQEDLKTDDEKWREYHTAWQNYYQQYFYRHYASYLHQKDNELKAVNQNNQSGAEKTSDRHSTVNENEALNSLRSELRAKISSSTQKARKSRHFVPIMAGFSVMLLFMFLQYNTQVIGFFASFVSPGNVMPENIIVDESIDVPVGPEPKLIIPKINVNEPIVWNTANDEKSQLEAMKNGVAWFGIPGANSKPGQLGNTVLSGHSTNNLLETGDHKFVFLHLPEMEKGDTAYINHQGKRYTYKVTKTEVVKPHEVDKLVYKTDVPVITLITCVPIGTAENRLLVTAEQIAPNPSEAKKAPAKTQQTEPAKMTGNSPSLLERIFGT